MSDTQQFIFGYGSLLESRSRVMTSPSALYASPVNVVGIQRGWFGRAVSDSLSPTYLGAVSDPNFNCNGVILKVSQRELESFDNRESGYKRERIDQKNITMLDGSKSAPEGDIWFYAATEKHFASPEFPIVQSYVDICLNGCLEIEATYPLAKEAEFAEMFLRTSTNWSKYWVNDRIYPRRPFIYLPNASKIDHLIKKALGEEMFSNIEIEPASWKRGEAK
ncbi:MAG TPA: gamma-glutamylcyclotransferase family protein [Blastocatellia bacterium]|nr:gamma-glutamylcyclotransferase family protein [Blastocatellia bacterium]